MTDASPAPSRGVGAAYGLLAAAIGSEVTGSLALAAGADAPAWYVVTGVGYIASFVLLGLVLRRGLPLGVAYAIWGATGVAFTAAGGRLLFDEPLTATSIVGFTLIVAGVALVHIGSRPPRVPAGEASA